MLKIPTQDGRALYALLEAIEADGMMTEDEHVARWRELQGRILRLGHVAEPVQLLELLRRLERAGNIDNSWINAHWRNIVAQSIQNPATASTSYQLNSSVTSAA